jgi:5-formyltetrahydrofolate cyclo-ligase
VALAFECQVVARLPVDPWDAAVDVIVTERRMLDCGASATATERGRAS